MTDRTNSDIASFLTPPPSKGVQFSQGIVRQWDNETLHNQIEWRGITLTDIPIIEGINALVIRPGDVVGMLGWAPENAKGVGSWWILGKLSNPGEFVADLNVTAKIFRFVTETGATLAFFGKDINGVPLWNLHYGGDDGQIALGINSGTGMTAWYREGSVAWSILGDEGNQHFDVRDELGHVVMATDGLTRTGLARPWFTYHLVPAFTAQSVGEGNASMWPSTDQTAYTDILTGINPIWHPRLAFGVGVTATGGGDAEWAFTLNGATLESGSGAGSFIVDVPGWGTTINPGDVVDIKLRGRVGGGGTRAWFQCDRLYGRQS